MPGAACYRPAVIPGGTQGRRGGWWSRLMPRASEHVSPDFYRMTGKLRVIVIAALTVTNLAIAVGADLSGIDRDAYWSRQAIIVGLGAVDAVLGAWVWRGRLSPAGMARVTLACGLLDVGIQLVGAHGLGSVNSHLVALLVTIVMFYRLAFTFRVGLIIFAAALIAHWGIVLLEIAGVLRPQAMAPAGAVDAVYRDGELELAAMVMLTVTYAAAFMLAHWAVVRLRASEQAVRILRQALHGGAGGQVGRHSGTVLRDTYEVGALLAAGGMGEVYRGFHRRTGRSVAIKFLHPHFLEDPQVLLRFRREAEIAGQLGSPHIVQVIDVDRHDELPFLVLELLEGESLRARLDRVGPLAPALVADLITQVAAGLYEARQAGVVHRDLKPENLFLTERGLDQPPLLKILDFGISKIQGAATLVTGEAGLLGTPDFMAPEQAEGQDDQVDHQSDVFALGAIAYQCLTGRRPFAGPSIPAVLRAICDVEPTPPSALRATLSAEVDAVVAIAMAKRRTERYDDARSFARDLRLAAEGTLGEEVRRRAARLTQARVASAVSEATHGDTLDAGLGTGPTLAS